MKRSSDQENGLVLVKLGGALITNKEGFEAPRMDVISRLAAEIAAWPGSADGRLVVTHGSGSFAHRAVIDSGFREQPGDRVAFARVAASAARLNTIVVDALIGAGLPTVGIAGGRVARCRGGKLIGVCTQEIERCLATGLVPTTYGDVVLDSEVGGAIASTDELIRVLASALNPIRVIMATDVDGIYLSDPKRDPTARRIEKLTPGNVSEIISLAGKPGAQDVSGGMAAKVTALLSLVQDVGIEARVISGLRPGALALALEDSPSAGGTLVAAK